VIFHKRDFATFDCHRNIEMTPLCNIDVTLPRVLRSRGCTLAVLSMSKQEFSRLDVLLPVQSGHLRLSDGVLIGLQRHQVFRLRRGLKQDGAASLVSKHRGRPANHLALAYAQIFVHGQACSGHPCGAAPANYLRCRKA
jgi:hypothetical protein